MEIRNIEKSVRIYETKGLTLHLKSSRRKGRTFPNDRTAAYFPAVGLLAPCWSFQGEAYELRMPTQGTGTLTMEDAFAPKLQTRT